MCPRNAFPVDRRPYRHTAMISSSPQVFRAGVHERDMFSSIADSTLVALTAVVNATRDDCMLLKATSGLYQFATVMKRICANMV